LQPENGICIKSWFGNAKDSALYELAPLLLEIADSKLDFRKALAEMKESF